MSLVGRLEDLALPDIFQIISLSRKTGALIITGKEGMGAVVFKNGQVIQAAADFIRKNIEEILLSGEMSKRKDLDLARELKNTLPVDKPLEEILLEMGMVSRETLEQAAADFIRKNIEEILLSGEMSKRKDLDLARELKNTLPVDKPLEEILLEMGMVSRETLEQAAADFIRKNIEEILLSGEMSKRKDLDLARELKNTLPVDKPLEEILLEMGMVSRETLEQAAADFIRKNIEEILLSGEMSKRKDLDLARELKNTLPVDKPLEEILLEMGMVSRETLEHITRQRIEDIVYRLLLWQEGDFSFELGETDIKERVKIDNLGYPLQHGMSPEYLIMESTRLYDERKKEGEVLLTKKPLQKFEPLEEIVETDEWEEEDFLGEPTADKKTLSSLKAMVTELRFPTATSEITLLILRYASDVVNRGVLFMAKKDEVVGLGQFGIDLKGESPDQRVRNIRIPLNEPSVFTKVFETRQTYRGGLEDNRWNNYLINEIGSVNPLEVLIIPLVSEGRIIALFYGDNLPEMKPIGDVEGLEIFINQAGLAIEKALLERKIIELEKMKRKETERRYQ